MKMPISAEGIEGGYEGENGVVGDDREWENQTRDTSTRDEIDADSDLVYGRRLSDQEIQQKKGLTSLAPGYNYNLGLLNSGMTRLNMFNSFANSTAYYNMVNGLGIN